jgi:hypothetical protein
LRPLNPPDLSSGRSEIYNLSALPVILSVIEALKQFGLQVTQGIVRESLPTRQPSRTREHGPYFRFHEDTRDAIAWIGSIDRQRAFSILGPQDDFWALIVLHPTIEEFYCSLEFTAQIRCGPLLSVRWGSLARVCLTDFCKMISVGGGEWRNPERGLDRRLVRRLWRYFSIALPNVVQVHDLPLRLRRPFEDYRWDLIERRTIVETAQSLGLSMWTHI